MVPNFRHVWSITSGRKQSKIFLHLFSKNEKQMNNYTSSNSIRYYFKYFRSESVFYFPTENSLLDNKWCLISMKLKTVNMGLFTYNIEGNLSSRKTKRVSIFFFRRKRKTKTYQPVDLDRDKIEIKGNLILI